MICSQCCGLDAFFSEKFAARELRRYRRRGPIASTRLLIELLKGQGVRGASVLDVGGGIGAVQHELLKAGAVSTTDIDGSQAYINAARREAQRLGHADRMSFRHGDFVDLADEIDGADIVTLDRVICCYPDMPSLVDSSTAHARRLYGLVFPRTHWLTRTAFPVLNLFMRLRRCSMRVYLHAPAEVRRAVETGGFALQTSRRTLLWQVEVYCRTGASPGGLSGVTREPSAREGRIGLGRSP